MIEWTPVSPGVQTSFDLGQKPQVESGGDLLNQCYELRGSLDLARLHTALQRLHESHDALRLRYRLDNDGIGFVTADPAGAVPYELLRPAGWEESLLPRLVPALGAQFADAWDLLSKASAKWALLQLAPDRHMLATWYFRPTIDARSITTLNARLWSAYFYPERTMPSSSYLHAMETQVHRRERSRAMAHWQSERERLGDTPQSASELSITESCEVVADDEKHEELHKAASRARVSLSQLLAHRFASVALATNDDRPILLHHLVNERDRTTADIIGNFSTNVPVVLAPNDIGSPRSTAVKLLRAFGMRPRTPGERPSPGYVQLNNGLGGFGYNYLPAHFQHEVHPSENLAVTEFSSFQRARHPSRLSLSVIERIDGGLGFTLSYHPNETSREKALQILSTVTHL